MSAIIDKSDKKATASLSLTLSSSPSLSLSMSSSSSLSSSSIKDTATTIRKGDYSTGTSIMALSYKGGVVMGADSRTSSGDYVVNRVTDKLTFVHDSICCARSGSAADTQAVADIVAYYLNAHSVELNKPPLVKTAAALFQDMVYGYKDRLLASIIVAGWDKEEKGSVYTVNLGGATIKSAFAIGGSGSTYLWGLCDELYKPDMSEDECKKFVIKALSHAMARDGYSGGCVRVAVINDKGVKREMVTGDKLPYTLPPE
eukprot:TRINITY_DN8913_c0_g1_i1.p1 TRINITY_DN8913_c0_g1~~TRINITY_DN8913_c0_g1_i1.p1  ORF type:complete len:258 (+),score=60.72 TRINITY_DN8913_c0_g1_i1:65-838(+)